MLLKKVIIKNFKSIKHLEFDFPESNIYRKNTTIFEFYIMNKQVIILGVVLFIACTTPKSYPVGQINTSMGEILFAMYDETPQHKASFIELAQAGYWDTLTFNRVIQNFVIQGGCPDTPAGFTDSTYLLKPEFHDSIRHVYGAVGIGRDNNPGKLSARCQFYIVQNKEGLARLDGNYMIFGKVIKGMQVVDSIAVVHTDTTDTPLVPILLDVNVIQLSEEELKMMGWKIKK